MNKSMNFSCVYERTSSSQDVLHGSNNSYIEKPEHSEVARRAWKSASKAAKYMSKHSQIVNPSLEKCIPRFDRNEIDLGEKLGSGGFNHVYEVTRINLLKDPKHSPHAKKISSQLQTEYREFVSEHVYREASQSSRYAVKFLSHQTIEDSERFCTGAADLVVEAKFLASLRHPNIIKLRGMAAAGTSGFATCKDLGYFLLLDRLQCTLEQKLEEWRLQELNAKSMGVVEEAKRKRGALANRLNVAFDISSALRYLHENRIIYRDLKPDNIGFDVRGDVKLFDFGLAKELAPDAQGYSESYELSGNTGSLRYMAPEVALCQPYNLSADTYSFGLLLWQTCSLGLPYDGMNRMDHEQRVILGGERPPLDTSWSTPVRILMKRAWEKEPSARPTMDSIYKILKREVSALRGGDNSGLENVKRRSTFVLNRESLANKERKDHKLYSEQENSSPKLRISGMNSMLKAPTSSRHRIHRRSSRSTAHSISSFGESSEFVKPSKALERLYGKGGAPAREGALIAAKQ